MGDDFSNEIVHPFFCGKTVGIWVEEALVEQSEVVETLSSKEILFLEIYGTLSTLSRIFYSFLF